MTEKDHEDFWNSRKCLIYENVYVKSNVKVRDYCHITVKYRGFAYEYYNIKVKLIKSRSSYCFLQLKNLWFSSYYPRTMEIWF